MALFGRSGTLRITMWKWFVFFSLFLACWPAKAEDIRFVTYHLSPPFITNEEKRIGLTYELAKLLSDRSNGRFQFIVEPTTRTKINDLLDGDGIFVIPWVIPQWFKDAPKEGLEWTGGIIDDGNALLFNISKPIDYSGPKSLIGRSIAGLEGGYWVGIDPLIKKGLIQRHEAPTYWDAMREVLLKRVDVAIIPYSVAKFLIAKNEKSGDFLFSPTPHSRFQRRLLIKGHKEVGAFLDNQSKLLGNSPEWIAIMSAYGL